MLILLVGRRIVILDAKIFVANARLGGAGGIGLYERLEQLDGPIEYDMISLGSDPLVGNLAE